MRSKHLGLTIGTPVTCLLPSKRDIVKKDKLGYSVVKGGMWLYMLPFLN